VKILRPIRCQHRAFTLIEVLVVISIIGALAGIVVPNVIKYNKSAQLPAAAVELHNVQTAVTSALADQKIHSITVDGSGTFAFDVGNDVTVANADAGTSTTVGAFLMGGNEALHGSYSITGQGIVTQTAFP